MAALVVALGGLYVIGTRAAKAWEDEQRRRVASSGDASGECAAPVEETRAAFDNLAAMLAPRTVDDFTVFAAQGAVVRGGPLVDMQLRDNDRDWGLVTPPSNDPGGRGVDRELVQDLRAARRNLYVTAWVDGAERAFEREQKVAQPFAFGDDSDFKQDALREHAMRRVPPPEEGFRQGAVLLGAMTPDYRPDPNQLLQSTKFKRDRRLIGTQDVETAIVTRSVPFDAPGGLIGGTLYAPAQHVADRSNDDARTDGRPRAPPTSFDV